MLLLITNGERDRPLHQQVAIRKLGNLMKYDMTTERNCKVAIQEQLKTLFQNGICNIIWK